MTDIKKLITNYDKDSDVLWIDVKEGEEDRFEEVLPGVNIEYNSSNEVIGIEFIGASNYFKQEVKVNSGIERPVIQEEVRPLLFNASATSSLRSTSSNIYQSFAGNYL